MSIYTIEDMDFCFDVRIPGEYTTLDDGWWSVHSVEIRVGKGYWVTVDKDTYDNPEGWEQLEQYYNDHMDKQVEEAKGERAIQEYEYNKTGVN